jgi:hypothetical protein
MSTWRLPHMDVIEGGGEPEANLHRRIRANCDVCGAALQGPMPKPFWMAPSARETDDHGHPVMEDSIVRVYLCAEHRKALQGAIDSAWRRERDRTIARQKMLPRRSSVRPVE